MSNSYRSNSGLPSPISHRILALAIGVLLSGTFVSSTASKASAAANDGIGAYFSAPFVQGPPASANAIVESFNNQTAGTCNLSSINATSQVGTFSLIGTTSGQTNPCRIVDGASNVWGGANTVTDAPTVNSAGTPYFSAPDCTTSPCSQSVVLTLPAGVKYVGFWWSAGNPGNRVRFYTAADSVNPIATYTTNTLDSTLGPENPSPYPGTAKVTALDGTEYLRARYFGRPANVPSLTTSSISALTNKQSHAYISLYATGSVAFSKIEFNGAGFEMDNIAIATNPGPVASNLVFLEGVLGQAVQFKANGGTGAMATQTSTTATSLTSNSFTRPGYQFAGWSTTSNGSGGVPYADSGNYAFAASTTLFAQWNPALLNVFYDEAGGSVVSDGTFTNGSAITLPAAPTKAGQRFDGWFTAPTGGSALGATFTPTGNTDVTLYARWSAVPAAPALLNVFYDEAGGSVVSDGTFTNGSAITLPAAPTKAGQRFEGWFTAPTGGSALGATFTPTGNTDVTLYARWSSADAEPTGSRALALPASGNNSTGVTLAAFLLMLMGAGFMALRKKKMA
jgi:uncharacterized repeat protein (TIGR02543 family)/LPXTG-motif cell wall-anchored protein